MRQRLKSDTTRGAITIVVFLLLIYASYKTILPNLISGVSGQQVTAYFVNTGQLKTLDPVRERGVYVGTINSIAPVRGTRLTAVRMTVQQKGLPLYRDATAEISERNLLGGTFYLNLKPGLRGSGAGSNTIPASRTTYQIEAEDVLSFDRGAAQRGLKILPGQLAQTFSDPSVPAGSIATLARVSPDLTQGLSGVRGQFADADLQSFVRSSDRAVRAFDSPDNEARSLVSGMAATLQTTAAQQGALQYVFSRSPAIQRRIQTTLANLQTTLHEADPLVSQLMPAADALAPTLAQFHPAVVRTNRLLVQARPLVRSLRPSSRDLAQMAQAGAPVVAGLTPSLARLGYTVFPYLNVKDPETQLTPAESVGPFFSSWGGAAAETDANGHFFRFPASGGEQSLSNDLPCTTFFTDPTAKSLIACDQIGTAIAEYLNYNPAAPTPGTDRTK